MANPWNTIDLSVYERHMSSESVAQLQALSLIMKEQFSGCEGTAVVLGAAGGNGLEHIRGSNIKKVFALDINEEYLDVCAERYSELGEMLHTICIDLSKKGALIPKCDLLICNLIIEYLGLDTFIELIRRNLENIKFISCVIQKNNGVNFVGRSETAADLESLNSAHNDIGASGLIEGLNEIELSVVDKKIYMLPGDKEFIRIDFIININEG